MLQFLRGARPGSWENWGSWASTWPSRWWRMCLEAGITDVTYKGLFVLLIVAHHRRRVVHVSITEHPTPGWTAQQVVDAFPWDEAPRYLLWDRDRIYSASFRQRVRNMGIKAVVITLRSPGQNTYVERIRSIRRALSRRRGSCHRMGRRPSGGIGMKVSPDSCRRRDGVEWLTSIVWQAWRGCPSFARGLTRQTCGGGPGPLPQVVQTRVRTARWPASTAQPRLGRAARVSAGSVPVFAATTGSPASAGNAPHCTAGGAAAQRGNRRSSLLVGW